MTAAAIIERLHTRGLLPIVAAVCKVQFQEVDEVCGRSRHPETVAARHMVWGLLRDKMLMSYSGIARLWCVDHTTVMAALKKPLTPVNISRIKPESVVREFLAERGEVPDEPLSDGAPPVETPCESGVDVVDPSRALASRALSDQDLLISQSSSLSGTSDSDSSCLRGQAREGKEVRTASGIDRWVYVIQAQGTRRFKIGITSLSAEERLKALQTGSPVALTLLYAVPVRSMQHERALHRGLAKYRTGGEWFELTAEAEQWLRQTTASPAAMERLCDAHMNASTRQAVKDKTERRREAAKRKAAELPIPDDWKPNEAHFQSALETGLNRHDVSREALAFRAHAEAHDRRCVRWDAAFRQWLLKAKPTVVAQRNGRPELPGRHRTREDAEPHVMTYRELKDDPGAAGGPPLSNEQQARFAAMVAGIGKAMR